MESRYLYLAYLLFWELSIITLFLFFVWVAWPVSMLELVLLFFCYVIVLSFFYLHLKTKKYERSLDNIEFALLQLNGLMHEQHTLAEAANNRLSLLQEEVNTANDDILKVSRQAVLLETRQKVSEDVSRKEGENLRRALEGLSNMAGGTGKKIEALAKKNQAVTTTLQKQKKEATTSGKATRKLLRRIIRLEKKKNKLK
ncbi:hypothetical protein HZB01_02255 [Candidatus Woesearchaeota archaeon]|nr:hypothetical protein [Candidatus Woesearchaeota archaeon]